MIRGLLCSGLSDADVGDGFRRYSLQRQAILQENYTQGEEGRLIWDCHRHDPDVAHLLLTVIDTIQMQPTSLS